MKLTLITLSALLALLLSNFPSLSAEIVAGDVSDKIDIFHQKLNRKLELFDSLINSLSRPPDLQKLENRLVEIGEFNINSLPPLSRVELRVHLQHEDLVKAAGQGLINTVKLMTSLNFVLDWLNRDSFSPLLLASRNGNYEIVELLLDAGADIDHSDEDGLTPLRYAVLFEQHRVARLLLSQGANVNRRDRYQWTPLLSAVANNDRAMVEILLRHGANPELKTRRGDFPLIEAIEQGNNEIVLSLLEAGANPDVTDIRHGNPALLLAIDRKDPSLIKLLIEKGAEVDARGKSLQETALMRAVSMEDVRTVNLLLSAGADINAVDIKGWTSLFYALERNNLAITKILLEHGIDKSITTDDGDTALDLWEWRINDQLRELLSG